MRIHKRLIRLATALLLFSLLGALAAPLTARAAEPEHKVVHVG